MINIIICTILSFSDVVMFFVEWRANKRCTTLAVTYLLMSFATELFRQACILSGFFSFNMFDWDSANFKLNVALAMVMICVLVITVKLILDRAKQIDWKWRHKHEEAK